MSTRRLYYDDSFECDFAAEVLRCEPGPPVQTASGAVPAWEVVLDRTAFYPASGGQPNDLGLLGEARVLDVREEHEEIVHLVDRPLERGPVKGCVDWVRRFDHMQQHTGQHLLSAVFQGKFGLPTVSFHLGTAISTIDLRGPEPTDDILEGAERAANQVIFEDRPVTVRYGTAEELAQVGVRKEVQRSGILRAIEIAGADLQPCGGTHLKQTGQIGLLLVRGCTKVRQDWRVEFVCGGRAERAARADFALLHQVAGRLSCSAEEVTEASERALAERDAHFKNARALAQRLAQAEASLLLQATPPGPEGLRVIARLVDSGDAEYLGQLATHLATSEKTIALLASRESGHAVFAQHPSAGQDMNALLRQALTQLGGKGGGTRDFARGRLRDPAHGEKVVAMARSLLSATKT